MQVCFVYSRKKMDTWWAKPTKLNYQQSTFRTANPEKIVSGFNENAAMFWFCGWHCRKAAYRLSIVEIILITATATAFFMAIYNLSVTDVNPPMPPKIATIFILLCGLNVLVLSVALFAIKYEFLCVTVCIAIFESLAIVAICVYLPLQSLYVVNEALPNAVPQHDSFWEEDRPRIYRNWALSIAGCIIFTVYKFCYLFVLAKFCNYLRLRNKYQRNIFPEPRNYEFF